MTEMQSLIRPLAHGFPIRSAAKALRAVAREGRSDSAAAARSLGMHGARAVLAGRALREAV